LKGRFIIGEKVKLIKKNIKIYFETYLKANEKGGSILPPFFKLSVWWFNYSSPAALAVTVPGPSPASLALAVTLLDANDGLIALFGTP